MGGLSFFLSFYAEIRSGLMVTVLDYGLSFPGSSAGRGHCVVFLSKTLYSHSASLHPGVQMDTGQINAWGSPAMNYM